MTFFGLVKRGWTSLGPGGGPTAIPGDHCLLNSLVKAKGAHAGWLGLVGVQRIKEN